jgi:hypothetical protein
MGWRSTRYGPVRTSSWSGLSAASKRKCRPRARVAVQDKRLASPKNKQEHAIRQGSGDLVQNFPAHKSKYAATSSERPHRARRSLRSGVLSFHPFRGNGTNHTSQPAAIIMYAVAVKKAAPFWSRRAPGLKSLDSPSDQGTSVFRGAAGANRHVRGRPETRATQAPIRLRAAESPTAAPAPRAPQE